MRLLLAVDDSPESEVAIRSLRDDLIPNNNEVLVLHAVENGKSAEDNNAPRLDSRAREAKQRDAVIKAAEFVRKTAARLASWGFRAESAVEEGDARMVILDRAKTWRPDLIVMGSHSRDSIERALMGSVSNSVMRDAECSLLIIKNL